MTAETTFIFFFFTFILSIRDKNVEPRIDESRDYLLDVKVQYKRVDNVERKKSKEKF